MWFKKLFKNIQKSSQEIETCEPKMYLILREDLAYKYIQGGHALAKFAFDYPEQFKEWSNRYLICLSVFNGLALEELKYSTLSNFDNEYSIFFEEDLFSSLPTAYCIFEDGTGYVSKRLKGLQLATK